MDLADPGRPHPTTAGPAAGRRPPAALATAPARPSHDTRPRPTGFRAPTTANLLSGQRTETDPAWTRTPSRLPIHARSPPPRHQKEPGQDPETAKATLNTKLRHCGVSLKILLSRPIERPSGNSHATEGPSMNRIRASSPTNVMAARLPSAARRTSGRWVRRASVGVAAALAFTPGTAAPAQAVATAPAPAAPAKGTGWLGEKWLADEDANSLYSLTKGRRPRRVVGPTPPAGRSPARASVSRSSTPASPRSRASTGTGQGHQRAGPVVRVAGAEPALPRHVRPRHAHGRHHRRPGPRGDGRQRERRQVLRRRRARAHTCSTSRSPPPTAPPTSPRSSPPSTGSSQHRNDPGLNIRVLNLSFGTDSLQDSAVRPAVARRRGGLAQGHRRGGRRRQRRPDRRPG